MLLSPDSILWQGGGASFPLCQKKAHRRWAGYWTVQERQVTWVHIGPSWEESLGHPKGEGSQVTISSFSSCEFVRDSLWKTQIERYLNL